MGNKTKDLSYWKNNCEEDYINTPISVLRYISELEKRTDVDKPNNNINFDISKFKDSFNKGFKLFKEYLKNTL